MVVAAFGSSFGSPPCVTVTGPPVADTLNVPTEAFAVALKVPSVRPTYASTVKLADVLAVTFPQPSDQRYEFSLAASPTDSPRTVGSPAGAAAPPPSASFALPLTGKNPCGKAAVIANERATEQSTVAVTVYVTVFGAAA